MSNQSLLPPESGEPPKKYPQMNHHILCVDDEEEIGKILVDFFHRDTNCKVDFVLDAEQAFKYLDTHDEVDLVITNVAMPGMDGIAMTKLITGKYPDTRVIILTGIQWDAREAAFQAGAKAYISKPFNFLDLLGIVEKVLTGGLTHIVMIGGKR